MDGLYSTQHLYAEPHSRPQGKAPAGAAAAELRQVFAEQLHDQVIVVFKMPAVHLPGLQRHGAGARRGRTRHGRAGPRKTPSAGCSALLARFDPVGVAGHLT